MREFFRKLTNGFVTPGEDRNQRPIRWGNLLLPASEAQNHFLVVGTTGSGKTTVVRLMLQSLFGDFEERACRAVVFDAKEDMFPILAGIVDPKFITTLNPFDVRGAAWDLAVDLDEPRVIHEFVSTIIPESSDANRYFTDAARHLMYGVMLNYFIRKLSYTLGDVFRPLKSIRQLKHLLRQEPATESLVDLYLREKRLALNVLSSIATKIQPFEPIAACWEHAEQRISLKHWLDDQRILILGNSEISRHSIDAINRCIFKRITGLTLHLPDSPDRRIWFVLDELTDAGKLDGLIPLAKKGRSKGASLLLAFQTISGLRCDRLYGTHGTDELLGQIGNRFVGRLECVATAEYFSQLIGDQERWEVSKSYTSAKEDSSSTSYSKQIRRTVLPSELMDLPICSVANGLHGIGISRTAGVYHSHIHGHELFHRDLLPLNGSVPGEIPRAADTQILLPWNAEQCARFGVPLASSRRKTPPEIAAVPPPSPDLLRGMFDDP